MLRPEIAPDCTPHPHRARILIDGAWHIPVRDIDTLEGIGWGTGLDVAYPPGEGWAVTHVGGTRFCAWYRSAK